jgi:hypothetical protein
MKAGLILSLSALTLPIVANAPEPSGSLGVYAIIERVVLEPNEQAPTRVRLHGAFAFVDGGAGRPLGVTDAQRGLMRFILPTGIGEAHDRYVAAARREWSDLRAVAGSGQAVGFGSWRYLGQFAQFRTDGRGATAPKTAASGGSIADFRVSAPSDTTAAPIWYETNVGVVRLSEASHASVIAKLRAVMR